ncbi:MAG: 23S rRNA (adenine(2503)-C(2))-methyltransferase RlmN [Planctomycetales bacterium]|nr:23S rRNA (adenine(2503)-C(2))-methyltransferase RlmN [Planctomycetales bacterium]
MRSPNAVMSQSATIFDLAGVEALRRQWRLDPQVVRQVRTTLLKRGRSDADALAVVPEALRSEFAERVGLHALALDRRCDSQLDGATKLLFRTTAGMLIESVVLRIATGRTTLCVSSQVGCAAACEFCATGKMGIAQNLSAAEILDQLVQAKQLLAPEGRTIRNLVFMGMGEPFHNEGNLHEALAALAAPELFHHPASRVLVSTVGLPEAMLRCARRFPGVNLALSLHSVRQETREEIIPLAKKYSLDELQRTIREVNRIQAADRTSGPTVMLEYLMLAGLNDSLDEARELAAWCAGLNVHVNLIPFNPIDDAPHLTRTPQAEREAFAAVLKDAGLPTTIRYSLGADVAAACGQLVRRENRARAIEQHAAASEP